MAQKIRMQGEEDGKGQEGNRMKKGRKKRESRVESWWRCRRGC